MKLRLMLFGITKEIIGQTEFEYKVPETVNVSGLKRALKADYPELNQIASLAVAVNGVYTREDESLREDDEIVLIPPVNGG